MKVMPKAEFGVGTIMLSGHVTAFPDKELEQFDAVSFIRDLEAMEKTHPVIKLKLINLYGGSVYEGFPIYSALINSKSEIHVEIHGLVASMGTIIALGAKPENTKIDRFSRMMFHRVTNGAYGNLSDIQAKAVETENLENQLIDIYAERTGMSADEVRAKWFDGADHYVGAQELVDLKIVGSIITGGLVKQDVPQNAITPQALADFYQEQIQLNLNIKNENPMKKLQVMIGALMAFNPSLKAESTEEEVLASVQELANKYDAVVAENAKMKADIEIHNKAKITDLVEGAVASNKIRREQAEQYMKLATADFESTKAVIDSINPHKPITAQLGAQAGKSGGEDRSSWTYQDYAKKDSKALAEMKANDPQAFEELKKRSFNK